MLQYRHYVVSRISYNCWLHRLRHRNDRRMQSSSRCSPANSWRCSDVLSTCFRRQYANVLRSRFEGQEMKRSYLVFQSALMTKLTKATNATTTIVKTQRRWHHQHPIKMESNDDDGFNGNLRNFVPQSPPAIDLLKIERWSDFLSDSTREP